VERADAFLPRDTAVNDGLRLLDGNDADRAKLEVDIDSMVDGVEA